MTTPPRILLLGRCGLERVADPLRELSKAEVIVAGWTQTELLGRLKPDLTYVDLFGWDQIAPMTAAAAAGKSIAPIETSPLEAVIKELRGHPGVLYRGLRRPSAGAFGLLDRSPALEENFNILNGLLKNEKVLDVAGLWARKGIPLDDVKFGMGHGEAGPEGAKEEARWLHALWLGRTQGTIKCIVLDLDDTLIYGKVVADDFHTKNPAYLPKGEIPSRPLLDGWWRLKRGLHEALKVAARRGILLAMATRNDPEVVRRRWRKRPMEADINPGSYAWMYDDLPEEAKQLAFSQHPEVLDAIALGPQDMVHVEAGFGPKSTMCLKIAAHLGISPSSLAFLDNSPYERSEVTRNAPEVLVLEGDVASFREQLLLGPRFTQWETTQSASLRANSYRSRARVKEAGEKGKDLKAFLHELKIEVNVRAAHPGDLYRIQELLQRTHQLNLTGHRPTLSAKNLAGVLVASCRDRIADHGVISVGIVRESQLKAWTCSCRVLPHRVAASILGEMLRRNPGTQAKRIPSRRNGATIGLLEESRGGTASWVKLS